MGIIEDAHHAYFVPAHVVPMMFRIEREAFSAKFKSFIEQARLCSASSQLLASAPINIKFQRLHPHVNSREIILKASKEYMN